MTIRNLAVNSPEGKARREESSMSGWRFCPHGLAGWSYNTHRTRRFCRICAKPQRNDKETGQWVDVGAKEQADFEAAMRAFEEDE